MLLNSIVGAFSARCDCNAVINKSNADITLWNYVNNQITNICASAQRTLTDYQQNADNYVNQHPYNGPGLGGPQLPSYMHQKPGKLTKM